MVPVHPVDRELLGMSWNDQTFIDSAAFWASLSPKIFMAAADALLQILQEQEILPILHYLDDFLLFGRPGTSDCQEGLHTAMRVCCRLGMPIAEQKMESPTQALTFLGIEVDTKEMKVRLPADKLQHLEIKSQKSTTKRCLL